MLDVCIAVLCGIPGSGKSTFAKTLIRNKKDNIAGTGQEQEKNSESFNWMLVSYDDIIPSDTEKHIIEKEVPNAWKLYRENIQNAVVYLIQRLQSDSEFTEPMEDRSDCCFESFRTFMQRMVGKKNGTVVILIDDNMYYSSMRYKYYQLTRKYNIGFCQVHIECDTDLSLVRNRQRPSGQVPEDIILNMAARFEAPNPEQSSWEKYSIKINTNASPEALENSAIQVLELISKALSDPSMPIMEELDQTSKEVDRQICSENIIHQADIVMRKLIAEYMSQAKGQNTDRNHMKSLSACLSCCKSDILQELKRGMVYLSSDEELLGKLRDIFHEKLGAYGFG
ncbi:L-seryl-tRNA(Sec) kinase-like [Saccostrea echinata]|uniref:L-seryl-tRNA(Sec) kinase-like n=1 Tax=Saccostrea echinata TaxID=191078 RepID=UPI002A82A106|nr:L-seryl-tRNA(Sec) kinase-like [Saccostrea echinata]XP_061194062.1 L-seryl-tRNA(Sec) kinase-like [Saccostrea echinata]XP_061194063.1 L-seryl-tRNA(Sec) kinase-like [Saccostrea echinata]